ncbi:MAG: DUF1996 domain-containing protein [Ilumatobacter sp.]|nr:DUF1996 domain-containing protein [Ilumatobacter sp.]
MALAASVASTVPTACADSTPSFGSSAAEAGFAAPDRVIAGPQGSVGQFVVECGFDRFLADDPIVHPGDAGASHLHQFFGAVEVHAGSVDAELIAGDTTCDQAADTASYWAPALIGADGEPIAPTNSVAYYRAGPGVDPATVVPFPPGFMAVAGDHTAIEPQPTSVVAFACGVGSARFSEPPSCGGDELRMVVTFQDCWDGEHVRSPVVPEPDRHVSYSRAGECPPSHPVAIPQLQFAIDYPPIADRDLGSLLLASGDIHTGHADFWNTWDQEKLANEVARCINRDLVCGLAS